MAGVVSEQDQAWRDVVTDPAEMRVFESLADERWELRTIRGMARDAGLPPERVQGVIDKHAPLIREANIPDSAGNRLFALRERPPSWREHFTTFIAMFSGSSRQRQRHLRLPEVLKGWDYSKPHCGVLLVGLSRKLPNYYGTGTGANDPSG